MTKRKKQQKKKRPTGLPSPRWQKELDEAMLEFQQGDELAAQKRLVRLAEQHPGKPAILVSLLEVCGQMEDWHTYAYYAEQLLPLEHGQDRAETLNNLVYVYMQSLYPVLAYHTAHILVTQHPNFSHIAQALSFMEDVEPKMWEIVETLEGMPDISTADKLNVLAQHERIRFYTESGHAQKAIPLATSLLQQTPNVVAVLNNLSLAYFMVGDVAAAKAAAGRVLALSPQNVHALSNMVRFTFLTGQFDQAQQYADLLAQIEGDNPDVLTKQVEAFATLGDDASVQKTYERTKNLKDAFLPLLLLHLAAAAYMRQGDEKTAWRLWQEAVSQSPDFEMARTCLAEKRLPAGERHVPWYWPLPYWGLDKLLDSIRKIAERDERQSGGETLAQVMHAYSQERPYLPRLFACMLEWGDDSAREFALTFINTVRTPELLQTLYHFATGQYGTNEMRARALQFLNEHHPEILPANRQVPVWINGQQTVVSLMGFEITDEPELWDLPEGVLEKHEAAYDLIIRDKLDAAEKLLHEIIAAAPYFPSAYQHLALIHERQGRAAKARALVEETYARFPDYLFARASLAQLLVRERRVAEAKELLMPLMQRTRLHISEFRALARAQIDVALAEDMLDAARSWFSMWKQVDMDNAELGYWETRIGRSERLSAQAARFLSRRRQKKRK